MKIRGYILIISIVYIGNIANACICDQPSLENQNWDLLDEIFIGKVLSVQRKVIDLFPSSGGKYSVVGTITTFSAERKWKGSSSELVEIIQTGSSCSQTFYIEDFNYLITAQNRKFANNVKSDTLNDVYLTSEDCYLTISERTEENLYTKAVTLLDSIYDKPIELTPDNTVVEDEPAIFRFESTVSLLFGLILGAILMFLMMKSQRKLNSANTMK